MLISGVLAVVALPFLGANFILRDYRELPADNPARAGTEQIAKQFPGLTQNSVDVAFPDTPAKPGLTAAVERTAAVDHVVSVEWSGGTTGRTGPAGSPTTTPPSEFGRAVFNTADGHTWVRVNLDVDAESPEAADAVRSIRAQFGPIGGLVGGTTASLVDSTEGITDNMPYAIVAIVAVTAVLLFLLTGSVVLPVIGVALSVLSLGATFGSLVFVFSDGHFSGLLGGFTAFGAINVTAPILLFCIAYGLSMDYQMFILSRIAEERAAGRSSEGAIQVGVAATRRVIGAAAILIAVVLAAMATSGLTYLKILGFGLAVAVLVDAFVVRLFQLPNAMRIFGDAVWYRPSWLDPLYERLRLSHGDVADHAPAASTPVDDQRPSEDPVGIS